MQVKLTPEEISTLRMLQNQEWEFSKISYTYREVLHHILIARGNELRQEIAELEMEKRANKNK